MSASASLSADTVTGDDGNILIDGITTLPVGLIDAGTGDVTLDSLAAINGMTDDGVADINGSVVNLTAASGGIGASTVLDVTASTSLSSDSSGDNGTTAIDSIGPAVVASMTSGTGALTLDSTGAINSASDDGVSDITGGTVSLIAAVGGIGTSTV